VGTNGEAKIKHVPNVSKSFNAVNGAFFLILNLKNNEIIK